MKSVNQVLNRIAADIRAGWNRTEAWFASDIREVEAIHTRLDAEVRLLKGAALAENAALRSEAARTEADLKSRLADVEEKASIEVQLLRKGV